MAIGLKEGMDAMVGIDLEALSLEELKQLQKDVSLAIASFEKRKRTAALAALEAAAKEHGYNLTELMSADRSSASRKQPLPPKYRHPDEPTKTWSGRGRQPEWVKEKIAAGKTLDDLLID
ncbi:MAG: H-NS histone family protein [Pseudomonadota bacterium]